MPIGGSICHVVIAIISLKIRVGARMTSTGAAYRKTKFDCRSNWPTWCRRPIGIRPSRFIQYPNQLFQNNCMNEITNQKTGDTTLSGPMFEPAKTEFWHSNLGKSGAHYNLFSGAAETGVAALRQMFPDGEADDLNFCLFSTSGVHGMYTTIEEIEQEMDAHAAWCQAKLDGKAAGEEPYVSEITFLVVHPRLVCLRWGNAKIYCRADIEFLKKLRASSWAAVQTRGKNGT